MAVEDVLIEMLASPYFGARARAALRTELSTWVDEEGGEGGEGGGGASQTLVTHATEAGPWYMEDVTPSIILVTNTDAAVTGNAIIALPATFNPAVGCRMTIKKVSGTKSLQVNGSGNATATIDGVNGVVMPKAGDCIDVVWDGSNWHILARVIVP